MFTKQFFAGMLLSAVLFGSGVLWAQAPRPYFVDSTGIVNALGLRGTCSVPPCEITDFDVSGGTIIGSTEVGFGTSGTGVLTSSSDLTFVDATNLFAVNGTVDAAGNIDAANNLIAGDSGGTDQHTLTGQAVVQASFSDFALRVSDSGTGFLLFLQDGSGDGTQLYVNAENSVGADTWQVRVEGSMSLGTTEFTSAGVGDIVLPNAVGELRFENAAGNDTVPMISSDGSDNVTINPSTGTLQALSRDAVDSCGVGFRCLRVPN